MNELNFKRIGSGNTHFIILHGLLGMLDNWLNIAKKLSISDTNFSIWLIDQRNHGKSFHSDELNYYLLSQDLYDFTQQHNITEAIVLGHSMGGKVAMQFACEHHHLVKKLIVVDIAPKSYPRGHDNIFEALFSINPQTIENRQQANEILSKKLNSKAIAAFLLKNLKRNKEGGFYWKANIQALYDNYEDIIINSLSPFDEYDGPTLFIKGGLSSRYIEIDDYELILHKFPNAKIEVIDNAGHWVHAEQTEKLIEQILQFVE